MGVRSGASSIEQIILYSIPVSNDSQFSFVVEFMFKYRAVPP